MLGIEALGFSDSDRDQDAGQETYGDEEPVGMQGKGAYGKEIRKHSQSSCFRVVPVARKEGSLRS